MKRVIAIILTLLSPMVPAESLQQSLYREAHSAVRANDMARFYQIRTQLKNYPLLPYLDYYRLAFRPGQASFAEVTRFLRDHADTPQANRLERSYLQYLAQSGQWTSFLQLYPQLPESTSLRCMHYQARYYTGQRSEALKGAEALWMSGQSRPDDCDGLFTLWQQAGLRTTAKIWLRMGLAFSEGNGDLIRHLAPALGAESDSKLLQDTFARPAMVLDRTRYPDTARGRDTLLLGLARYANDEALRVLNVLPAYKNRLALTTTMLQPVERAIARRMLLDRLPDQRSWLDTTVSRIKDDELLELRARMAVWELDWRGVARWIAMMPSALQQSDRWQYWQARAMASAGQQGPALALYSQTAKQRGYYGFLAAQRANIPYRLVNNTPRDALAWEPSVRQWPFLARVKELKSMHDLSGARAEWLHNLARSSDQDKLQFGMLAERQGWHDLAIQSTIVAQAWDAMDLRFPMPLKNTYQRVANQRNMDMTLLYAISRQESAMYPLAESPAGARGLMQLMPATARHTAGKIGYPYRDPDQLFDPDVNVSLGSAYLQGLLNNYGGNRIFAAAAYNAGPGRVARWRAQSGNKPADVWIEGIPYRETRNYVQNILSFSLIYQHKAARSPLRLLSNNELHGVY